VDDECQRPEALEAANVPPNVEGGCERLLCVLRNVYEIGDNVISTELFKHDTKLSQTSLLSLCLARVTLPASAGCIVQYGTDPSVLECHGHCCAMYGGARAFLSRRIDAVPS
jgi:hypothetical protein